MDIRFEHNLRTRQFFVGLLDQLDIDQLNLIPKGFSNNIIWNIVHSMTSQQGLVYGLSLLEQQIPRELALMYKNGTVPQKWVSKQQVAEYKSMLIPLIEQTYTDYRAGKFTEFKEYTTGTGYTLRNIDDALSMNNIHEALHLGYALAIRKAIL